MPRTARPTAALLSAMVLSGAAALIYEIVWLRMLTRAFGVTVHAVSFLVALFFAGLALGSAAAARWTRRDADWLKVYAGLEIAGALAAAGATFFMGALPGIVASLGSGSLEDSWLLDTSLRFLLGGPALLLPTFFFGATLPVLSRFWVSKAEEVRSAAGRLYAANTLGAVLGAGFAGFLGIAAFGERGAAACAVALNLGAAGCALSAGGSRKGLLAGLRTYTRPAGGTRAWRAPSVACWLYAVSGFCAIGYEVLWSRRLTLLLGNSVYAFSLLLACFLGATALGSAIFSRARTGERDPWEAFGLLQLVLAAAALASLGVSDGLALLLDDPAYLYSPLTRPSDLWRMALQALLIVGPAAFVMGCLFPLAARLEARDAASAGSSVGMAYAFNTGGGILGSLAAGFLLLETLGSHGGFAALAVLNAGAGVAALLRSKTRSLGGRPAALLAACVAAGLLAARNDRTPETLSHRFKRMMGRSPRILFHEETPAGTATGMMAENFRGSLLINGIVTAGTGDAGALMVALPAALIEDPRKALIVGVGAGVSVAAASSMGLQARAVDLMPAVIRNVTKFHPPSKRGLFRRPGIRLTNADGRHFLLRARERFDLILVDATPPLYSAGTVNLYTLEFLKLARSRLEPGGIFVLWLPTLSYQEDYWRILSAFGQAFPHKRIWAHDHVGSGFLILGSDAPLRWKPGLIDRRLAERVRPFLLEGLSEEFVRAGFAIPSGAAFARAAGYAPVTDDRPYTEFPLGKLLRGERLVKDMGFLRRPR